MQLDQIIIETRPRHGWSAIDLGVKLAVKHYLPCVMLWLFMATPFLVLSWLLLGNNDWIGYLILWWFKPLFERPLLYLLSRELFGQKTTIQSTLKNYQQWLSPGWFAGITWRRISLMRSFYLPLTVLEKLKGRGYSQRTMVLGGDFGSQATWLTVVLYYIEVFFFFGLISLVELVAPNQIGWTAIIMGSQETYFWATLLMQLASFALIAPFYIASGFMLYIARRIHLEGWDIELRFRDWVARDEA